MQFVKCKICHEYPVVTIDYYKGVSFKCKCDKPFTFTDSDSASVERMFNAWNLYNQNAVKIPIKDLNLSVRAHNALVRANFESAQDVAEYAEKKDIRMVRRLGKWSWQEVLFKLYEHQLITQTTLSKYQLQVTEDVEKPEDTLVKSMHLRVRTQNALLRAGLNTAGDIVEYMRMRSLLTISGIGANYIAEITQELHKLELV